MAERVTRVLFIDTSILCNLIEVPGRDQHKEEVQRRFRSLVADDEVRFVIPVTTVIETGNLIANAGGHRRPAATRLQRLIDMAKDGSAPWLLNTVTWDAEFLDALAAGAGTEVPLVDHLGNGTMGTGDLAILCERDAFRDRGDFESVEVWTLEQAMGAWA